MRLTIPLPYGELTVSIQRTKRPRPLFWFTLLSAALHVLVLSLIVRYLLPTVLPQIERQPILVALSTSLRIEKRARPQPARQPAQRAPQEPKPQQPLRHRAMVAESAASEDAHTDRRSHQPQARVAKPAEGDQVAMQLRRDSQALAQTAARLSSEDSPQAGLATSTAPPAAPKRYTLDFSGSDGKAQPEGVLYPMKRWTDGSYAYYYVRYLVYYNDGTTETGSVPWPIRFLIADDPFIRGIHHMPLPGPPTDYVLPSDASVTPLVRHCYDHRYSYCPIERESP
jgi:hypothetical protein